MKEKIYIDFDGTLYDSDNFYAEFLKICNNYAITANDERVAENKLFNGEQLFNLNDIANYLQQTYNLPFKFLKDIENLYFKPNLYDDVIESLEILKSTNKYEIIILTYGDFHHQLKKIHSAGLTKYIKDIIITSDSKTNLKEVDYQNSIFIDNNPLQIEKFINQGAKQIIRIRRAIDKYSSIDTRCSINEYDNLVTLVKKELI